MLGGLDSEPGFTPGDSLGQIGSIPLEVPVRVPDGEVQVLSEVVDQPSLHSGEPADFLLSNQVSSESMFGDTE